MGSKFHLRTGQGLRLGLRSGQGPRLRRSMLFLVLAVVGFAMGCAKVNDNSQSATVFINRGSALYNQQVNNGMKAYLAVDPMYSTEFNQIMASFYLADGTQIPSGIDPMNGVTINMMPINFNQQTSQAVINSTNPPMLTIYTKAGTQTFAISMAARGGYVQGQNFVLNYADEFRQMTIYGTCYNDATTGQKGVAGPVSFQIMRGQGATMGEQLLGYFSMPGNNNYCGFF